MSVEKVTALELVGSSPSLSAYEPRTIQEAREMAKMFAGSGLVKDVTTEARAYLVMATGAELGIPPTTALRAIHIIEDRPSLSAQLKIALCLRRKDLCKYFRCTDSSDKSATYETLRVGDDEPQKVTFTIEDAAKMLGARVDNKDGNWFKSRRRMLRWRAGSELADMVYPEVTLNLPSTEEMLDGDVIDMKPAPIQLDANLVGAAAAVVATGAAQDKAEREEQRRTEANETESVEAALKRWSETLGKATNVAECDKVAAEAKKRLVKDSVDYDRAKKMVGDAKERIKKAQPVGSQQSLVENPIDRPKQEREVGSDDE